MCFVRVKKGRQRDLNFYHTHKKGGQASKYSEKERAERRLHSREYGQLPQLVEKGFSRRNQRYFLKGTKIEEMGRAELFKYVEKETAPPRRPCSQKTRRQGRKETDGPKAAFERKGKGRSAP